MREPLRVGVVGVGTISTTYLDTLAALPGVDVTVAADLDISRAAAVTERFDSVRAATPDELYADGEVEAVLNLTVPSAHASVALAALQAGKHVYGEKPLAATRQEARVVLDAAAQTGLRLGCAPDTVLGTGTQTARTALDRGDIGQPIAASAFFVSPGTEPWHPNPAFYYLPGGGPLFDMGPYYLTSLVTLLGPVLRVTGRSSRTRAERTVGSGPKQGTTFPVEIDTHVSGVLEHASGVLTTLVTSFDVWGARLPRFEVYGSAGSLSVPDPNRFDGAVEVFDPATQDWRTVTEAGGYAGAGRGYGLADMARAIRSAEPHRASAELAFHVLDVMESLLDSAARGGTAVEVESTVERPAPVPPGAVPDQA